MKRSLILAVVCAALILFCAAHAEDFCGLGYESSMELEYAAQFSVDYYEGGYKVISVVDGGTFLVVPEGADVPEGLDRSMGVLRQPLDTIYMANTAAMCFFDRIDAVDAIRFCSLNNGEWYCDSANAAMEAGNMVFAGKYSEPDYEGLLNGGCDAVIENTMILHSPKVKEMLEMLGLTVFVDRSSYETHPLGRVEWIRLYGAMMNREDAALEYLHSQADEINAIDGEDTGATVAFFYVSQDGTVNVRGSSDYIPAMISIAGGSYVLDGLVETRSNSPSISMSMEQFYAAAMESDYIIYNGTMAGVDSVKDLLAISPLFADFTAVKNGNVWSTDKNLYQATDILGSFIRDIHTMLTGATEGTTFIKHLS